MTFKIGDRVRVIYHDNNFYWEDGLQNVEGTVTNINPDVEDYVYVWNSEEESESEQLVYVTEYTIQFDPYAVDTWGNHYNFIVVQGDWIELVSSKERELSGFAKFIRSVAPLSSGEDEQKVNSR